MTKPTTTGERLMQIETLLKAKADADDVRDQTMFKTIDEIRDDLKAIRKDLDVNKAELAGLKHRGAGMLAGVSIAIGTLGVSLADNIKAFGKLITG